MAITKAGKQVLYTSSRAYFIRNQEFKKNAFESAMVSRFMAVAHLAFSVADLKKLT